MVEIHRRLSPVHAIRFARRIEEYEPMWYEEPVVVESLGALAEVKRKINIPVVTGETLYSKAAFLPVVVC